MPSRPEVTGRRRQVTDTAPNTAARTTEPTLGTDLLFGAQAIADYLGIDVRRVYYQLQRGFIPATRSGAAYIASKKRLQKHFQGEAA
jgi:hypothetical protein